MGQHTTAERGDDRASADVGAPLTGSASRGLGELRAMIATGRPSAPDIAAMVSQYPREQGAMFALLHGALGNTFVAEVIETVSASPGERVSDLADAQVSAAPSPGTSPTTDVDALLASTPSGARGKQGTAAWLLEASALGFVDLGQARPQLEQFRDDAPTIHTNQAPYPNEDADRAAHPGRFDHVVKNPKGGYDLTLQDAAVLTPLVAVAKTRITAWRTAGGKKPKVLSLGEFVRADIGYGFDPKRPGRSVNSPHKDARAMDLFLQKPGTTADAVELLRDLPPGSLRVFMDYPGSLHLSTTPTGYELGIPTGNGYIADEHLMRGAPDYRCGEQDRKEREAGDDHGKQLEATAVKVHDGTTWHSTATWSAEEGKWVWKPWSERSVTAESLIMDKQLLRAIDAYRSRSRSARSGT